MTRTRTTRSEIETWLGDAATELTDEQIATLQGAADGIAERYPDEDDVDEREAALTVACRLLLEPREQVVAELADELRRARLAELRALAGIRHAAYALVRVDRSARGIESQAGFANAAGVDRHAVRDWFGLDEPPAFNHPSS